MRHILSTLLALGFSGSVAAPAWAAEPESQAPAPSTEAPQAPKIPDSTDTVMFWPWWHLAPGPATAGTPQAKADMAIYYTKQFWFTPNDGIYTFYNTGQAAVLRYQHRWDLPGDFKLVGMAGARAILIGNNPPTPSVGFRTGPEVALSLSRTLFWKVSGQIFGTYAPLFPLNADAIPAGTSNEPVHVTFYGLNVTAPIAERTSLTLGLQGQVNSFFTSGLQFHNLGPTFSINHVF